MSALYPLQDPFSRGVYLPTTMAFRGTWNATTQYYPNECALSPIDGALYLTTVPIYGGADPSTGVATWIDITKGSSGALQVYTNPNNISIVNGAAAVSIPLTPAGQVLQPGYYDIQLIGLWTTPAATVPAADDKAIVNITTGVAVNSGITSIQTPGLASQEWGSSALIPVYMRARVLAGALPLTLLVELAGTGVYGAGNNVLFTLQSFTVAPVS